MVDWAERAKAVEEQVLSAQIEDHFRYRSGRHQVSASHCRACGEPIPEARRLAVVTDHCADCAEEIERRAQWSSGTGRSGSA